MKVLARHLDHKRLRRESYFQVVALDVLQHSFVLRISLIGWGYGSPRRRGLMQVLSVIVAVPGRLREARGHSRPCLVRLRSACRFFSGHLCRERSAPSQFASQPGDLCAAAPDGSAAPARLLLSRPAAPAEEPLGCARLEDVRARSAVLHSRHAQQGGHGLLSEYVFILFLSASANRPKSVFASMKSLTRSPLASSTFPRSATVPLLPLPSMISTVRE